MKNWDEVRRASNDLGVEALESFVRSEPLRRIHGASLGSLPWRTSLWTPNCDLWGSAGYCARSWRHHEFPFDVRLDLLGSR